MGILHPHGWSTCQATGCFQVLPLPPKSGLLDGWPCPLGITVAFMWLQDGGGPWGPTYQMLRFQGSLGMVCCSQTGLWLIPDPLGQLQWRPGLKRALRSYTGCSAVMCCQQRGYTSLCPPNRIHMKHMGWGNGCCLYSYFPFVPSVRWYWISPPLTLRRRCMLVTCGPPSLEKVCAASSSLQVMMCWGESCFLGGIRFFGYVSTVTVAVL